MQKLRKPKVKNKYNLTPVMIRKLGVNREKVGEPIFWRNNVIDAWCISATTIKNPRDDEFGTYNEFWLGIYDENAKAYAGKIRFNFNAYGGMCDYKITKFYKESEIENLLDLEIQEKALSILNDLIDKQILYIQ